MCSSHYSDGEHAADIKRAQDEIAQSVTGLQHFFHNRDQDFKLTWRLISPERLRSHRDSQPAANRELLDELLAGDIDAWEEIMIQARRLFQDRLLDADQMQELSSMLFIFCKPVPIHSVDDTLQGKFG
jgi:hypothetical protein